MQRWRIAGQVDGHAATPCLSKKASLGLGKPAPQPLSSALLTDDGGVDPLCSIVAQALGQALLARVSHVGLLCIRVPPRWAGAVHGVQGAGAQNKGDPDVSLAAGPALALHPTLAPAPPAPTHHR